MLLTAAVLVTIALGLFCVWHRRTLWRRPRDRTITSAVMLMPVGLVLIFPAQEFYLGTWLHTLTGLWYLNDYLSLVCLMAVVCLLIRYTLMLSDADEEQTAWMMHQVTRPTAVVSVVMLVALASSPVGRAHDWPGPIMDIPDGKLWGMWFGYAIVQIWCLLFLLRQLLQMRKTFDRVTVNWFIATAVTGIGTELIVIVAQYTNSLFVWRWYGTLAATVCASVGGLRSWTSRDINGEEET